MQQVKCDRMRSVGFVATILLLGACLPFGGAPSDSTAAAKPNPSSSAQSTSANTATDATVARHIELCRVFAKQLVKDFGDYVRSGAPDRVQMVIDLVEDRRFACFAPPPRTGGTDSTLNAALALDQRMLEAWYNGDVAGRGEKLFHIGPNVFTVWREHYLKNLKLHDAPSTQDERIGVRMFRVDALAGRMLGQLALAGDHATPNNAILETADALEAALLAEVDDWKGLKSAEPGLQFATYGGSGHGDVDDPGRDARTIRFPDRVTRVSSYFASLGERWGDRPIGDLRCVLGRPYYAYVNSIIEAPGTPIPDMTICPKTPAATAPGNHASASKPVGPPLPLASAPVPAQRTSASAAAPGPPPPGAASVNAGDTLPRQQANADIVVRWIPPASGTALEEGKTGYKLRDVRQEVVAYDNGNLRGLFEARRAEAEWLSIFPRSAQVPENVEATRLAGAAEALVVAMAHTESPGTRLTHLSTLIGQIDLFDRTPVDATGALDGTRDAENAAKERERHKGASRAFAEVALCLLNRATIEGDTRPCGVDGTGSGVVLPCAPLAMRKNLSTGMAPEAFGRILGVLATLKEPPLSRAMQCELQSVLHRDGFVALQPGFFRYQQAIDLVTSERLTLDGPALGALLSAAVLSARNAMDKSCLAAGAAAGCKFGDLQRLHASRQSGGPSASGPSAQSVEASFCESAVLASGSIQRAVKKQLHLRAANYLAPFQTKDIERARDELEAAEVGCPLKPNAKVPSSAPRKNTPTKPPVTTPKTTDNVPGAPFAKGGGGKVGPPTSPMDAPGKPRLPKAAPPPTTTPASVPPRTRIPLPPSSD